MASQAIPLTLIAPLPQAVTGSAAAATALPSSPPSLTGVTQVTSSAGPSSPASTPSSPTTPTQTVLVAGLSSPVGTPTPPTSPVQAPTTSTAQAPHRIRVHSRHWDTLKLLHQWLCYGAKILGAAAGLVAAYIALSITVRLPVPQNTFYICFDFAT